MRQPARLDEQAGRWAVVDEIPFHLPVACKNSPALFAAFSINAEKARALIPGNEIYPFRLWKQGLLIVSVIDYLDTTIGRYIEFSIAIACTHGSKAAPRLLPGIFQGSYGTGQWVFDLPVSSEVSVKGGKGIWGMPKHQANLNYVIGEKTVSSQYDLDGQLAMKIEIERPAKTSWPLKMGAANYCAFRGLLMKSSVYFTGRMGFSLGKKGAGRLTLGDHPRVQALKGLEIEAEPLLTAFVPAANGVLDDHFESWFLSETQPTAAAEGLKSVVDLGQSQEWLAPPIPASE